jgi:hypothetical protein
MKHDRKGGKRTNWLLIKHHDEFSREGDGDSVLTEDKSVASGRAMSVIAAGKGLDWTEKFRANAKQAAAFQDCLIDGEIVALDQNGAPDFAALQAALSEQNTDDLIFYAFDLLATGEADLRARPLSEREKALQGFRADISFADPVRRAFRDRGRRRAPFRLQTVP